MGDTTMAEAPPADMERDAEGAQDAQASGRGNASAGDAVKSEGGKHGEPAAQQHGDAHADGGDAAGSAGVKQQVGANGNDAAGAVGASPATAGRPEASKETMEEAAARRRTEANILRRAAAIREAQAKAQLAAETPPYELPRARCHWDYVLAEMAWMAVDFAGERIWKLNAAAQLGAAAVAAKGSPKMKKLSEDDARKIVAARAAACVTEFWVRMKKRAADDAVPPDAPPAAAASRGSAALEAWAIQLLRERVAAAAAGAKPRLGDDDAMPFSGKHAPTGLDAPHTPLLWGEAPLWGLTYVPDDSATELLSHAAAAETAAIAACEERMRAWEENERNRQRAVAEMARLVREDEEHKTAVIKQQAAANAVANAAAAAAMPGGYPAGGLVHGGYGGGAEWDERRRKKSKKGMYGYEEDDLGGANILPPFGSIGGYAPPGMAGIPSKRMRTSAAAASAARAAAVAGDMGVPGRYGYMGGYAVPAPGQGGLMPAGKHRKGDEMGVEDPRRMRQGDMAADRRGGRKSGRAQGPQISIVAMPWSPAEDALLQAIVREFCRPRPNWALVSDVLAQGAPFRGVFRRPDHCRTHWDQLSRAQAAAAAAAQPGLLPPPADGAAPDAAPAAAGGEGGEPREDDAARSKRRLVLTNLLPIEQELLKVHLEQLVAVAARYRARRGAEGSEVPARRSQPHSSWLLLGAEPLRSPAELADAPPPPPSIVAPPAGPTGLTPGVTPGDSRQLWSQPGSAGWTPALTLGGAGATPAAVAAAHAAALRRMPSQPSPPGPTALMAPPPRAASGKSSKSRGRSGSRADGRR